MKTYEKYFWNSTANLSKHLDFNPNGTISRERLFSNENILLVDKNFDKDGVLFTQTVFRKTDGSRRAIVDFDKKMAKETSLWEKTV